MSLDGTYYDRALETMAWPAVQERSLARAIRQVERVYESSPYYRRKYDAAGFHPADLRHSKDMSDVPFFDKEDERRSQEAHPPLGEHLCVDPMEVRRVHASSGSTGTPTFFALTEADLRTWDRVMGRAFYTAGVRENDVFGLLGNLAMFVGGVPVLTAVSSLGATVVPIGVTGGTERTIELMRHLGVTTIGATASFAVHLAGVVEEVLGLPACEMGVRRILMGGEPGAQIPAVRAQVASTWSCSVRDVMGIGEVAGAFWAESDDEEGMHFCGHDEVHVELVDPSTGAVVPFEDGATGELVYTAVERQATPVVRFRSRDHVLVRMAPTESGRTAPRITPLGRTDDMLIVRGVNLFPTAVRDVVGSFSPRTTGHIRIVIDEPGPSVSPPVEVEVEVGAAVPPPDRTGLAEEIQGAIRARLQVGTRIVLVDEGALPRTALKTSYVHLRA